MCKNSISIFKMEAILDPVITIRIKLSNQFWPEILFHMSCILKRYNFGINSQVY